jgi:hypothetical protein
MLQKTGQIQADSLGSPVRRKRALITAPGGPLEHLQLKAQLLTLQTYSLLASSIGMSYLSFISHWTSLSTSISTTLLGSTISAYLLQGGWLKAQTRYFENHRRVDQNVGYDLQVCLLEI